LIWPALVATVKSARNARGGHEHAPARVRRVLDQEARSAHLEVGQRVGGNKIVWPACLQQADDEVALFLDGRGCDEVGANHVVHRTGN
jgi:hypothetical protein